MKKPSNNAVTQRNIEIAMKLKAAILRCLLARGMPKYLEKSLRRILSRIEIFLKDPTSKTFLDNISHVIEIIIKLIRILEILGK